MDNNLVEPKFSNWKGPPLQPPGGGGISDEMEARVKRLEDDSAEMRADLKAIRHDLALILGRSEKFATAETVGRIQGRIDRLPTVGTLSVLLGIAIAFSSILPALQAYVKLRFGLP